MCEVAERCEATAAHLIYTWTEVLETSDTFVLLYIFILCVVRTAQQQVTREH